MRGKNTVPAAFGRRLQQERKRRGWTMADTARKCDMTENTVERAESGNEMMLSNAVALATLYGCSLDDFLLKEPCKMCVGLPPDGYRCLACGAITPSEKQEGESC